MNGTEKRLDQVIWDQMLVEADRAAEEGEDGLAFGLRWLAANHKMPTRFDGRGWIWMGMLSQERSNTMTGTIWDELVKARGQHAGIVVAGETCGEALVTAARAVGRANEL